MKRLIAALAASSLVLAIAVPVAAADFPEQAHVHACAVVQSLPKDVLGHLAQVSPATADRLSALLADACNL